MLFRFVRLVAALAVLSVFVLADPALADTVVQTADDDLVTLEPILVTLAAGTLIPILTGVLTKLSAPTGWKVSVSIALSIAVGSITQIVEDGGSFHWKPTVFLAFTSFIGQLAAYLGLWKPIGKDKTVPLQTETAAFGLG